MRPIREAGGATAPYGLADGNVEVLNLAAVLGVFLAFQGKGNRVCGGKPLLLNGGLPPSDNARLVDMKMPRSKLPPFTRNTT